MRTMSEHPPEPVSFYRPGAYRADESVGYLIKRVLSSMVSEIDQRLAAHDLTYVQWLPLYKLAKGEGDTLAALARELDIDPGALTRSIDRLQAKGLLQRERSTADRRVVHLRLTDAGRAVAREVAPVLAAVLNAHLQGFTHAEWQQLINMLRRMLANGEALRQSRNCPP